MMWENSHACLQPHLSHLPIISNSPEGRKTFAVRGTIHSVFVKARFGGKVWSFHAYVYHSFGALPNENPNEKLKANRKFPFPPPDQTPQNTTTFDYCGNNLVHLSDESVNLVLAVTKVTTLNKVAEFAGAESSSWVGQLEWPEEVGSLLEVGADGEDLVDQILHADNPVLAERVLDDGVVGESNALLLDLSVTTLVDELADGLQVRVSVGDPWLDNLEHLESSLGHANKDTVVDLEKTEELEDLAGLGGNLVDTVGS